jgi:hypothetical protein
MADDEDDFPDLEFGGDDVYTSGNSSKKLYLPATTSDTGIGRSVNLSSNPTIVHFGGFTVGKVHEQDISIVNCSPKGQRISILPMTTDFFKVN